MGKYGSEESLSIAVRRNSLKKQQRKIWGIRQRNRRWSSRGVEGSRSDSRHRSESHGGLFTAPWRPDGGGWQRMDGRREILKAPGREVIGLGFPERKEMEGEKRSGLGETGR